MWWIFEKVKETEQSVEYSYSREGWENDGVIEFSKITNSARIDKPCAKDVNRSTAQSTALEHFQKVIKENFPNSRRVICG